MRHATGQTERSAAERVVTVECCRLQGDKINGSSIDSVVAAETTQRLMIACLWRERPGLSRESSSGLNQLPK